MSDRYEGLDLTGLMDLMHDLVVPEPVAWTPQTSGWPILAAWLAVVTLVGIAHWLAYRRRNRYRREAESLLAAIENRAEVDPVDAAVQIATLVKRTALVAYPREQVASLYGAEWAAFLRESSAEDPLVVGAADRLAAAAYQSDADGRVLVTPARRWIRRHRA